jgi:predicted dinucleotide-binding enzyme
MKIGVIGAGGIGQAFSGHAARAGYEVILSNSRGPDSLAATAREMGSSARAGTREEAAQADVVFLAVQWPQVASALAGLPAWNGRILIDATNAVGPGFSAVDLNGKGSSEVVACSSSAATTLRRSGASAKSSAGAASPPSTSAAWRAAGRCSNSRAARCRR